MEKIGNQDFLYSLYALVFLLKMNFSKDCKKVKIAQFSNFKTCVAY